VQLTNAEDDAPYNAYWNGGTMNMSKSFFLVEKNSIKTPMPDVKKSTQLVIILITIRRGDDLGQEK
jgi:hypothetical protein